MYLSGSHPALATLCVLCLHDVGRRRPASVQWPCYAVMEPISLAVYQIDVPTLPCESSLAGNGGHRCESDLLDTAGQWIVWLTKTACPASCKSFKRATAICAHRASRYLGTQWATVHDWLSACSLD